MLGYIVWLISFKVADAVVGRDGLGILSRFNLQFTFIKNVYISICFILKILTDFRKTVETGMDPRLQSEQFYFILYRTKAKAYAFNLCEQIVFIHGGKLFSTLKNSP